MSRGLGQIQRRILAILQAERGKVLPTSMLTTMVYMSDERMAKVKEACGDGFDEIFPIAVAAAARPKPSQRNAVSRACFQLWEAGLVQGHRFESSPGVTFWGIV